MGQRKEKIESYKLKKLKEKILSISDLSNLEIRFDEDMTNYSTMRLVGRGHILILKTIEEVELAARVLPQYFSSWRIVGFGSNQLFPEESEILYVKLELPWNKDELATYKETYELSASVPLQAMTKCAIQFNLKGWEVFTGIPACLGGSLFMNAGTALGEIGSLVEAIHVVRRGGQRETIQISKFTDFFQYRKNLFCHEGDFIIGARMKHFGVDSSIALTIKDYLAKRAASQPLKSNTCGCVFKNPSKSCLAGKTLDILGLKGFTYKNFRISPVHANFIENLGGGTYSEFCDFIEIIQEKVEKSIGQRFELEVKLK